MHVSYINREHLHIAVGVSGGADSLALCLLADNWGRQNGVKITALTVDHGIRKEAKTEAAQVKLWLENRGIPHNTLVIEQLPPHHGIQAFARKWRFHLLGNWCRNNSVDGVMLAHTIEDQAETVYMRILADSGPEGLSGMRNGTRVAGLTIIRPLLTITKGRLIETCRRFGQNWVVDPSNQDLKYTRVMLRQLKPGIEKVGLEGNKVVRLASAMRKLRNIFDQTSLNFMKKNGGILGTGIAWINASSIDETPIKFLELLLGRLLISIGGTPWPSKKEKLNRLICVLRAQKVTTATLGGCVIEKTNSGTIWIYREIPRKFPSTVIMPGTKLRWDNRFEVIQTSKKKLIMEPLGETGWKKLKRISGQNLPDIFGPELPFRARISIPIARSLDDDLFIPHFEGVNRRNHGGESPGVFCNFHPDSFWVYDLAKESL